MSEKDLWLQELNRIHFIDCRDKIHLHYHDQFGDKAVHVTAILCSIEILVLFCLKPVLYIKSLT